MNTRTKLLAGLIILLNTGCKKDFLQLNPQSSTVSANFYKTKNDFITAINGAYGELQKNAQYGYYFMTLMEVRSDNVVDNMAATNSGLYYNIDRFNEGKSNNILNDSWLDIYSTINYCNNVINKIDAIDMDDSSRNRLKGEAFFIRGLCNFNAVRLWGKIPLVVRELSADEAKNQVRNEVADVYKQIEADLNISSKSLPSVYTGNDIGRATSGASRSLLGKVLLYQKKYEQAAAILKQVIDSNKYQILTTLTDVYSVSNKNNAELIFSVKYKGGGVGEGHSLWYNGNNAGQDSVIEPTLKAAYLPQDKRLKLMYTVTTTGTTIKVPAKFVDVVASSETSNDFPVMRYADVLLMYAEVLNEAGYVADGEAFKYVNQIRVRAGIPALTAANTPNQDAFRNAVWNERRLELALECDRWFDLVRTGQAITAMAVVGRAITAKQFIYAIPQNEINVINNPTNFPRTMAIKNRVTLYVSRHCLVVLLAILPGLLTYAQVAPILNAHAHNDYVHEHPLWDALSFGFTSVEADIYLIKGELYVSHERPDSLKKITLRELYLAPLQKILANNSGTVYPGFTGIFYLMIDLKADAGATFKVLRKQIREYPQLVNNPNIKIFLTSFQDLHFVLNDTTRLVGIDGRGEDLEKEFGNDFMPIISEPFKAVSAWKGVGPLPEADMQKISALAEQAHQEGKKLRLWGIPDNQNTWKILLQLKVDLINTDRLKEFSEFNASWAK